MPFLWLSSHKTSSTKILNTSGPDEEERDEEEDTRSHFKFTSTTLVLFHLLAFTKEEARRNGGQWLRVSDKAVACMQKIWGESNSDASKRSNIFKEFEFVRGSIDAQQHLLSGYDELNQAMTPTELHPDTQIERGIQKPKEGKNNKKRGDCPEFVILNLRS